MRSTYVDAATSPISRNKDTLFGANAEEKLTKFLAKQIAEDYLLTAGSLRKLCAAVAENPNVLYVSIQVTTHIAGKKCILEGTLEQLARILLDHTLVSPTNEKMIDEGAAEVLRDLRTSDKSLVASQNVSVVVALPSKDDKETHEGVLYQANCLMQTGAKHEAVMLLEEYMRSITPTVMRDNGCYLKLMQLHSIAFNQYGNYWITGPSSYEFRDLIITAIQKNLPPRILQELFRGHRQFIEGERDTPRLELDEFEEHVEKLNHKAYSATGFTKPVEFTLSNDGVYFEMLNKAIREAAIHVLCDRPQPPVNRLGHR